MFIGKQIVYEIKGEMGRQMNICVNIQITHELWEKVQHAAGVHALTQIEIEGITTGVEQGLRCL